MGGDVTGPTDPSAGSPPPPTLPTGSNTNTHSAWTHYRVPLTPRPAGAVAAASAVRGQDPNSSAPHLCASLGSTQASVRLVWFPWSGM